MRRLDVFFVQNGYLCDAEVEVVRVLFCKFEHFFEVVGRLVCGDSPASERGVFVKGAFHVHCKGIHKSLVEQVGKHERAHAVGVHFDWKPDAGNIGENFGESAGEGGFATCDGHAVEPHLAFFEVAHDSFASDGGEAFRTPSHAAVVAGGALEVATACEEDAAGAAGPITKAQAFNSAYVVPSSE